jgi:hypothetical protein
MNVWKCQTWKSINLYLTWVIIIRNYNSLIVPIPTVKVIKQRS